MWFVCSMYCDYFILFIIFKIKCPGKIPNIRGIWEVCPGNQWFQVGNSVGEQTNMKLSCIKPTSKVRGLSIEPRFRTGCID